MGQFWGFSVFLFGNGVGLILGAFLCFFLGTDMGTFWGFLCIFGNESGLIPGTVPRFFSPTTVFLFPTLYFRSEDMDAKTLSHDWKEAHQKLPNNLKSSDFMYFQKLKDTI